MKHRTRGPHPHPEAPLPGESAGASLKHAPASGARRGRRHTPRRICRGLIEAPPPSTWRWSATCDTPRRICRGLIEAGRRRSGSRGWWTPPLPGESAGASLKRPDPGALGARGRSPLPGESAGASLKQDLFGRRGAGLGGPLPGESAGASLKLGQLQVLRPGAEPALPGESAGASLKHVTRHPWRAKRNPLPGESAGASLKPYHSTEAPGRKCGHSPANLPGPH